MLPEPVSPPEVQGSALLHADLIGGASVPMPHSGEAPALVVAPSPGTDVLQLADLLDSGSPGLSVAGGFVLFEHQGSSGSMHVRVMLEGADHHQLFDVGTLACGPDLNSLLGLIVPDGASS
ncbi:MAG: hypothetical protein ACI9ZF_000742 [Bradyrhizobium sp.]|jgi:hypothetical protein